MNCPEDLLLAQGLMAPIAINTFNKTSVYFIADETNLNIYICYKRRLPGKIKFLIIFLCEWPFYKFYCYYNRRAIDKASVIISNSYFMAKLLKAKFNKDSQVFYPSLDDNKAVINDSRKGGQDNIIMIGDGDHKGVGIFIEIAKRMPDKHFLIYSKKFSEKKEGNIEFKKFTEDTANIYNNAKIVLVPSVWDEAFGRVSIEAGSLGVPVLVSNRGGLPETVPSDKFIISQVHNINEWVDRIREVLNHHSEYAKELRLFVDKFRISNQAAIIGRILKSVAVEITTD